MNKEEFKKSLEEFCKNKNFKLSEKADKIIDRILIKNGNCPCRMIPTLCPCEYHEEEIKENGRCYCGLFVSES